MKQKKKIPYFLWDYNLTETEVRKILKEGSEIDRRWLIGRILSHAHFRDVFKYLTLSDILDIFPKLRMRNEVKRAWQRAFSAWGYHVNS